MIKLLPLTTTSNMHSALFPDESVAEYVICVVPIRNFIGGSTAGIDVRYGSMSELSK